MHYILIVMMGSYHTYHMGFTAEFNDQKSCQAAIKEIGDQSSYHLYDNDALCVPKGGHS